MRSGVGRTQQAHTTALRRQLTRSIGWRLIGWEYSFRYQTSVPADATALPLEPFALLAAMLECASVERRAALIFDVLDARAEAELRVERLSAMLCGTDEPLLHLSLFQALACLMQKRQRALSIGKVEFTAGLCAYPLLTEAFWSLIPFLPARCYGRAQNQLRVSATGATGSMTPRLGSMTPRLGSMTPRLSATLGSMTPRLGSATPRLGSMTPHHREVELGGITPRGDHTPNPVQTCTLLCGRLIAHSVAATLWPHLFQCC